MTKPFTGRCIKSGFRFKAKLAIAASEAAPYSKTGGLGDVMQALPEALSQIPGNTVALFLPYYGKQKYSGKFECEFITNFTINLCWRQCHVGLFKLVNENSKVQTYFIDNEQYFDRADLYGYKDDGDTAGKLVQAAETAPLLVLDDLGAEKPTEWVQEQLFIIINKRYEEMLPTLITTNCNMAELIDRIGRRTADRILEMTTPINIKAADYRMKG